MCGDGKLRPASASLPTPHQLRAALRAGLVAVAHTGGRVGIMTAAWRRTPTDAVFSEADLRAGADLLVEIGLLAITDGSVRPEPSLPALLAMDTAAACELLAERTLDTRRPLWVTAAVSEGRVSAQFIPDQATRSLTALLPDAARREAFLLAMGRRFTQEDLLHVGNVAEDTVAKMCRHELTAGGRPDLAARVTRVSQISDQLGYDVVAPRVDGARHLEVKGTRARGSVVSVHLSRNEATSATRDPDWSLVVCRVYDDDSSEVLGWATAAAIAGRLPADPHQGGAWETAVVYVDTAELNKDLPPWRR
jgi:hypothetical protein